MITLRHKTAAEKRHQERDSEIKCEQKIEGKKP